MAQAHNSHIADRALAAFIIIQAALKRSRRLQSYAARPDLNSRMPNFQVQTLATLHPADLGRVSWAWLNALGVFTPV